MEDSIILINNNDYGATELKKVYQRSFREGLLIAVLLHVAAIAAYLLVTYINNVNAEEKKELYHKPGIIVDILETPPSVTEEPPKIKPEDIVKPQKDLSALEPHPVKKEVSDNVLLKSQDELDKIQNNVSSEGDSVKYIASTDNGTKIIPDDIIKKIPIDDPPKVDKPFESFQVEVIPECVNLGQVRSSMQYPSLAVEAGIEGKVSVKVLVDETGNVIKVGSFNGNEIFSDEVKEKSKDLVFKPGLQNNKAVKVWITVPFSFKLKN